MTITLTPEIPRTIRSRIGWAVSGHLGHHRPRPGPLEAAARRGDRQHPGVPRHDRADVRLPAGRGDDRARRRRLPRLPHARHVRHDHGVRDRRHPVRRQRRRRPRGHRPVPLHAHGSLGRHRRTGRRGHAQLGGRAGRAGRMRVRGGLAPAPRRGPRDRRARPAPAAAVRVRVDRRLPRADGSTPTPRRSPPPEPWNSPSDSSGTRSSPSPPCPHGSARSHCGTRCPRPSRPPASSSATPSAPTPPGSPTTRSSWRSPGRCCSPPSSSRYPCTATGASAGEQPRCA